MVHVRVVSTAITTYSACLLPVSPQTDIQFNTDMIDREDPGVFRDASGNAVFYLSLRAVDQGIPPLSSETDVSSAALAQTVT